MGMKHFTPAMAAKAAGGVWHGPAELAEKEISLFVRDNRQAVPGAVFACLRGARVDGHRFAKAAVDSGALCCLAEEPVEAPYILVPDVPRALADIARAYRQLFDIPVIAITGSVGKTSAKEAVAAVLGVRYRVHKTPENLNNQLGVPLTLLSMPEDTTAAVVEMGISDFGEMEFLADMVLPTHCVMTNIGACHLEQLGDLDGVWRAKSPVFSRLPETGAAIVCGDDDHLRRGDTVVRKVCYGLEPGNDMTAENVTAKGLAGTAFTLVIGSERQEAFLPAYGSHLVYAALAAAAVGRELGLSLLEIARGLREYRPVGGRANAVTNGSYTVINDCYNANPQSVGSALRSLGSLSGRRAAVLGDMLELGPQGAAYHRSMGVLAAEMGIEALFCTGELSQCTCEGYREAGGSVCRWLPDRESLAAAVAEWARPGDTVLVKASHGMHFEEIVSALCPG